MYSTHNSIANDLSRGERDVNNAQRETRELTQQLAKKRQTRLTRPATLRRAARLRKRGQQRPQLNAE